MKNHGKWFLVCFLALIALAAQAAGPAAWAADEACLNVGTLMDIKRIDIDDYYYGILRGMLTHMGVVKLKEDGSFGGDMAESWETPDGKDWTFHLRPGLVWHDGKPATARDIKFSLEYLKAKLSVYGFHFKLVDSVDAPDDATVVIHLSEPNPRFLVNLVVLRVIPEHIFAAVEDPKAFDGPQAAIGCGPFIYEEFDRNAGVIRFRANDRYYRGRPNLDRVSFRLFKNADALVMAFRSGEVNLPYFYAAGIDPVLLPPLLKEKSIAIQEIPNLGVPEVLWLNLKTPPLDQRDLRLALSCAVDYDAVLRFFSGGFGSVPNSGFVPRGSLGFVETPPLKHDPDRARKLLEGLGYVDEDGDGVLERDGRPLELELVVRTDMANSMRLAELLSKHFGSVGVKLVVRPVDNTLFRQISDKDRSHALMLSRTTPWGMMMWAGLGTGYLDARNIGWSNLDDPAYYAIVDRMNRALDPGAYLEAAAELQAYHAEQMPVIPLFWNRLVQPYNRRFEGWAVNPMYGFLCDETWLRISGHK